MDADLVEYPLPEWVTKYGGWVIPVIFLLRALGEFKYVGFFKRVKNTEFAKWDAKLFSPLCLFIGVVAVVINFID